MCDHSYEDKSFPPASRRARQHLPWSPQALESYSLYVHVCCQQPHHMAVCSHVLLEGLRHACCGLAAQHDVTSVAHSSGCPVCIDIDANTGRCRLKTVCSTCTVMCRYTARQLCPRYINTYTYRYLVWTLCCCWCTLVYQLSDMKLARHAARANCHVLPYRNAQERTCIELVTRDACASACTGSISGRRFRPLPLEEGLFSGGVCLIFCRLAAPPVPHTYAGTRGGLVR
jgi:hypothetical protein